MLNAAPAIESNWHRIILDLANALRGSKRLAQRGQNDSRLS
jgi:hypothetical protein